MDESIPDEQEAGKSLLERYEREESGRKSRVSLVEAYSGKGSTEKPSHARGVLGARESHDEPSMQWTQDAPKFGKGRQTGAGERGPEEEEKWETERSSALDRLDFFTSAKQSGRKKKLSELLAEKQSTRKGSPAVETEPEDNNLGAEDGRLRIERSEHFADRGMCCGGALACAQQPERLERKPRQGFLTRESSARSVGEAHAND